MLMAPPLTYNDFGTFIGDENPYAQPDTGLVPANPGDNVAALPVGFTIPGPGGTTVRNPVSYVWDFRHAFPFDKEPGDQYRALKVQNYRIVKAILIPYSYNRHIESRNGGRILGGGAPVVIPPGRIVSLVVTAHLLIGYTPLVSVPARALPGGAAAAPGLPPYEALGLFIRDQTPTGVNPNLLADPTDRATLEVGVSWLSGLSAFSARGGGPRLKSTSDNEMDLIQEQQCLNWDFEADAPVGGPAPFGQIFGAGAIPAPLNPQYPPAPPAVFPWLRNWQVSKAIRTLYDVTVPISAAFPTGTARGEILVGFTGGGGM